MNVQHAVQPLGVNDGRVPVVTVDGEVTEDVQVTCGIGIFVDPGDGKCVGGSRQDDGVGAITGEAAAETHVGVGRLHGFAQRTGAAVLAKFVGGGRDLQFVRATRCLKRPGVAAAVPGHAPLVSEYGVVVEVEAKAGINGRASFQQRLSEGGAAVVLQ